MALAVEKVETPLTCNEFNVPTEVRDEFTTDDPIVSTEMTFISPTL